MANLIHKHDGFNNLMKQATAYIELRLSGIENDRKVAYSAAEFLIYIFNRLQCDYKGALNVVAQKQTPREFFRKLMNFS